MALRRKPPAGTVRRPQIKGLNIRGQITNKVNRIVPFESEPEHLLLLRFDRDPLVWNYATRPEKITYPNGYGVHQTLTPDMLVWRANGTAELHVITIARDSPQTTTGQSVAATQRICQQREWEYIAHIRDDLSNKTEFANLQALFLYRPTAYAHSGVTNAVEEMLNHGSPTLSQLIDQICADSDLPPPVVRGAIGHLIWHGKLAVDLNQLLIVRGAIVPTASVWLV